MSFNHLWPNTVWNHTQPQGQVSLQEVCFFLFFQQWKEIIWVLVRLVRHWATLSITVKRVLNLGEESLQFHNNFNIRNSFVKAETHTIITSSRNNFIYISNVNSLNIRIIQIYVRKESCAHFEVLCAVPLSAAGWQQNTAVSSELDLLHSLSLSAPSWQTIRAPLWQISICSFRLFHFQSSFFYIFIFFFLYM